MRVCLVVLLILIAGSLCAGGIGFGQEFGWETGEADYSVDGSVSLHGDGRNVSFESYCWNVGFVMDTNINKTSLFNYRMKWKYGTLHRRYSDMFWDDMRDEDFILFSTEHTFGFKILRTEKYRLWVGPTILLQGGFSDNNYSGRTEYNDSYRFERETSYFNLGIGPSLGFNYRIFPRLAICAEFSILHENNSGKLHYDYRDDAEPYETHEREGMDFHAHTTTFMLKFYPMLCYREGR